VSVWESIVLGFVQGATEFLPVSSSGHLVMTQALLGITIPGLTFEIGVHVATLVSILIVYRTRVLELIRGAVTGDQDALQYIGLIVVATVPAGLLGVLAKDRIATLFDNPYVPGVALLVTGGILWSSRWALDRGTETRPTWAAAGLIGIAQAFALIPGISRSGSTVVAAMWLGLNAREAAAFSFLMAIPAVGGAAVLQLLNLETAVAADLPVSILVGGSVMAGITGVLAIRTFVVILARRSFHYFAPYCWVAGLAYLAILALR
jgi:undecaprenyl-diphosphatase